MMDPTAVSGVSAAESVAKSTPMDSNDSERALTSDEIKSSQPEVKVVESGVGGSWPLHSKMLVTESEAGATQSV